MIYLNFFFTKMKKKLIHTSFTTQIFISIGFDFNFNTKIDPIFFFNFSFKFVFALVCAILTTKPQPICLYVCVCKHSLVCLFAQNPESALTLFKQIHQNHPKSPSAQYHYAKALDQLAELNRSNQLLQNAIDGYQKYLELNTALSDDDFKMAAERCIDRMRFIGISMIKSKKKLKCQVTRIHCCC